MSTKPARPDLMEQYGVSLNSTRLQSTKMRGEGVREQTLDRIGGMGMAALSIKLGDQSLRTGESLYVFAAAMCVDAGDRQDELVGELAPLLWRLKAGGQANTKAVNLQGQAVMQHQAAVLFARWMSLKPRMQHWTDGEQNYPRLLPFAQQVLFEWLFERCGGCGGSGRLELTNLGAVPTSGRNARNTRYVQCRTCSGTGKAIGRDAERSQALGLLKAVYDAANWGACFRAARIWLDQIARRPNKHLRRELERS